MTLCWEDERYVRFYSRDTAEWLALSWQARGLFGLIIRAVDRAGILKLGKVGPRGVAALLHAPWVEIAPHLEELLHDGCIRLAENGTALLVPNFIEAQETIQTDAARKRKSRELARIRFAGSSGTPASSSAADAASAAVAAGKAPDVTKRDPMESQNVTASHASHAEGHTRSRGHEKCHSVPSVPSNSLSPARVNGQSSQPAEPAAAASRTWNQGVLNELWFEIVRKTPSTGALEAVALQLENSAAMRRNVAVEDHAREMLSAFVALLAGWKANGKPCPQPSVDAFQRNFAACEEVVAGERDPAKAPASSDSRTPPPSNRPRIEPIEDVLARTHVPEADRAPPPPNLLECLRPKPEKPEGAL